jgi:hypothetical protein
MWDSGELRASAAGVCAARDGSAAGFARHADVASLPGLGDVRDEAAGNVAG